VSHRVAADPMRDRPRISWVALADRYTGNRSAGVAEEKFASQR
jgi:hypothetical protein